MNVSPLEVAKENSEHFLAIIVSWGKPMDVRLQSGRGLVCYSHTVSEVVYHPSYVASMLEVGTCVR